MPEMLTLGFDDENGEATREEREAKLPQFDAAANPFPILSTGCVAALVRFDGRGAIVSPE
jgi:hypothetical protein